MVGVLFYFYTSRVAVLLVTVEMYNQPNRLFTFQKKRKKKALYVGIHVM